MKAFKFLKKGDKIIAKELYTGRKLERGMPCFVTESKSAVVEAIDSDENERRFNYSDFEIERV